MAGTVTEVKMVGLEKLLTRYQKMPKSVESSLIDGVNKATGVVLGSAKAICPVDTGLLRSSIHITPAVRLGKEIKGQVGTSVEYAPFVEFGTGVRGESTNENTFFPVSYSPDWAGQIAQPYLMPALENNADKIEQIIARAAIMGVAMS